MRLHELSYPSDGVAVSVAFHPTLTIVPGLVAARRRRFTERLVGALRGLPAGNGASLVFFDGIGGQLRLTRDHDSRASLTELATGNDLSDHLSLDRRIDWLALLGLDPNAVTSVMLLDAAAFARGPDDDDGEVTGGTSELTEAREVLARVELDYEGVLASHRHVEELRARLLEIDDQLRRAGEDRARRRHGQAIQNVRRLEAELAQAQGAEPAEHVAAEAARAAARAGEEWRRAGELLEEARRAFGDRRRLDPRALARARQLPVEPPTGLDGLHAAYLAAADRRDSLIERLEAGAASELPAPSAPWVLSLARNRHPELWARAERVRDETTMAARLSMGLGGAGRHRELVARLEEAHREVEMAERQVASARVSALAVGARRRLAKAYEAEQAVLDETGFVSWLAFQMRRIDVLLEQDAQEALQAAEAKADTAMAAWRAVAGNIDPIAALAARPEVESYASQLAAAESSVAAAEMLRTELKAEAEPACEAARRALVHGCQPFEVSPENAPAEIAAIIDEARRARLQVALEQAEAALRQAEAHLESELAQAGWPGPGDLRVRVAAATALAAKTPPRTEVPRSRRPVEEVSADLFLAQEAFSRLSRPDWDETPLFTDEPAPDPVQLAEDRARLADEIDRAARNLPDASRLADRRSALQRRVSILEASSGETPPLVGFEKAEMVLLGRFAQARRVGPGAEAVPLLVDDALAGFPRHEKLRLLDFLARLGEASQVVYLTDDPDTVEWANARAHKGRASISVATPTTPFVERNLTVTLP